MAFLEQLLFGSGNPGGPNGLTLNRLTDAIAEPVTLDEAKDWMGINAGTTDDDKINLLIKGVRLRIESLIERTIFTQTWLQVVDRTPRVVNIYRRPLLRVNSIKTINSWDTDTQVLFAASGYSVTAGNGSKVISRSYWPAHRGYQSFLVNFDCGIVDLTDLANVDAARAAVPSDIKLAIHNYIAFLFENREGVGPVNVTEHLISLKQVIGEVPRTVKACLLDYLDYRP